MADNGPRSFGRTAETLLALIGGIGVVLQFRDFFKPTHGPRLKPGELTGGEATARAAAAYFEAERAAAQGRCTVAAKAFRKAERLRKHAEKRAARGDYTTGDVRESWRAAWLEVEDCRR